MKNNSKSVIKRCADNCCMLVVDQVDVGDEINYNISIQSSYYETNSSFWKRLKNAFKILFGKPVYYNDLYIDQEEFKELVESLQKLEK